MPELLRDPIVGRWVIVSDDDPKGPSDFEVGEEPQTNPENCPFCPGHEHMTPPEIFVKREAAQANGPGWSLRVVANKFPALKIEGELDREAVGLFDMMNGVGAHEVIIETPDHSKELSQMEENEIEQIIWAYITRTLDLRKDKRFQYILLFKNHGKSAGASLSHPHTQLIALPMVPKSVQEELQGAERYFNYKERCVYCDMARQEGLYGKNVISANDTYLAFCPYASRFPFEAWIMPKEHFASFDYLEPKMVADLAQILKYTLARIRKVLKAPSYNFIIHSSPIEERIREEYHWHIEIIPKLSRTAGFEWGSGFYINPTPSELAAKYLRGGNRNGNKSGN